MKGKCFLCNKTFSKAGMTKHLKACIKESGETKLFHIMIEGLHDPEYWLHIEISADAILGDLDQFLRDIWLECCGHLSKFTINRESYSEEDMNFQLNRVLKPGMEFYHIYDFGSSTELRLRVVSEREGKIGEEGVRILARNELPLITCGCGKNAKWVCTECIYEGEGWLCDECAKEHECGEEMLLPVVNSPRVGVCGYNGGKYGN